MQTRNARIRAWTIGLLFVLLFALLPVLWLISLSFKTPDDGHRPAASSPSDDLTLDNYEALFSGGFDDSPFIQPLINSILIALIATAIAIVLAAFTAYAIARLDFPGKALILAGALAIAMFPAISTVGPLFDMWRALGLYDTYLGLIIPYLAFALPLAIYILVPSSGRFPGTRAGGRGGRRDAVPGVPQGDHPARRAGRVHGGDPRLHLLPGTTSCSRSR